MNTGFWSENTWERYSLEDLGVDGKNGHYRNMMRRCGLDSSGSGYGPVAGPCEHGNEPSGYIKSVEFDWLRET
jgi:hypothetical protein